MNNKNALLMVHFGTTHDDTREKTIEKMNNKFKKEFPNYDFFEAYTSRIVLKKLKDRNIIKEHPLKVLEFLKNSNYENIIVQSSHIIPGIEYVNLMEELASYKDNFKDIKLGKPLLYNVADYKKIVRALEKDYIPSNKKEALVLVCHGTDSPIGAAYAMMEYVFDEHGYENVYVVSTKEYPLMDTLLKKLKKDSIEEVILAPFMFVAGEHAKKDMAEDFKEELEENNFKVNKIILKGLGEFEDILNIYLEHLKEALEENGETIAEFKKNYSEKYL